MAIICRDYDKEKMLDRIWYKSSNILYSECDDKKNELKTLRVVFNNGSMYEYKDVDVQKYIMFVHGGLDGSNGKALNQFIKPYCVFEKLESVNKEFLTEEMNKVLEKQKRERELLTESGITTEEQQKTEEY